MTFDEYSKQAEVTAQYIGTPIDRINYVTIALAGEVGEYMNDYKKHLRVAMNDYDTPAGPLRTAMLDELGDVLWYLSRVAYELGSSLELVAQANIAKLNARYSRKEE